MLRTTIAATVLGAAVIAPAIASSASASAAPAFAAPVSTVQVVDTPARTLVKLPVRGFNAKKSTMDCNGVTYQHDGYSYGWGNAQNRVIYGLGSAGNIRAVKVFRNDNNPAKWAIGVIGWSGATVETRTGGAVVTYCVDVGKDSTGVKLTSWYNGNTATQTIRW